MGSQLLKKFFCLLLVFLAMPALAQSTTDFASVFTVPANDISKSLLGYIFGQVEGVLTGGGSLIVGKMFSIFNSAVLALGGIVIIYTLFVSTINTAHEGQVMGQKWSSIWIPIRSALGVALLLPKESGYSLIQIFIMWVVLQGVGAADTIWGTVVDYINSHGSAAAVNINQSSIAPIAQSIGNALRVVGCKNGINREAIKQGLGVQIAQSPIVASQHYITFGGTAGSGLASDACGSISWDPTAGQEAAYLSAIIRLISDADTITSRLLNDSDNAYDITPQGTPDVGIQDAFINPALTYVQQLAYLGSNSSREIISQAERNQGWIVAGAYYTYLGADAANGGAVRPPKIAYTNAGTSLGARAYATVAIRYITYIDKFVSETYGNITPPPSSTGVTLECDFNTGGGEIINKAAHMLCAPVSGIFSAFQEIINLGGKIISPNKWVEDYFMNPTKDPIVQLQKLGQNLLTAVEAIWLGGGVVVFAVTLLLSNPPSINSYWTAVLSFLAWFVPLLMSMLTFLFIGGAMLAYYVPLVFYLMFTFGALGWILTVIEAIVAAPIVALGLMHPEGDQLFGEAKHAIMLLTAVFLRPSLMIFGLVTAIALSFAAMTLVNVGFATSLNAVYKGGFLGITSGIALIILYISIVVAVLTFVARLITLLPNRVMRWIGGSVEGYGEEQMMGEVKEGMQQGMGGVGKGMETAAGKTGDLGKSATQAEGGGGGGSSGSASQGGDSSGGDSSPGKGTAGKGASSGSGSDAAASSELIEGAAML